MSSQRKATTKNRELSLDIFLASNLQAVLDLATEEDWRAGLRWYRDAHEYAVLLSKRYGVTVEQASGIIAALSPQTGWDENKRIADLYISDPTESVHTSDACGKAARILAGEHPEDVLGGNKVRSFYRNIVTPNLAGPVTIDRHAIAILLGCTTPEYNVGPYRKVLERKHVYRIATAFYRDVARRYGLLPHELQAVAWLVQSGRSVAADPGQF
jgi:hypothetical protein